MAIKKTAAGRWLVDVEPVKGRRFRKTFDTKAECLRFEAHIKAQAYSPDWSPKKRDNRRLSDLILEWYALHGCNLRDGARRFLKLNYLAGALRNPVARNFSASVFADYRVKRLDSGISGKTLNNELGYLRAVYNELRALSVIDYANPLECLKPLQLQEQALSYLDAGQVKELLSVIQSGCDNPHVYPITLICLATGCRWSEAEKLPAKNLHKNQIVFEGTKSTKVRAVPVSSELVQLIRSHWKQYGHFTGSLSAFRRALQRCTFKLPAGQSSHVLRHTFASQFVQGGGNILVLQKILGHSTVQVTMRYAHLAPDHLADALRLNPLASFDTFATLPANKRKTPENV